MSGALLRLIDLYEERGELDQAQTIGRRLVNLEPWNEGNHRRLIQLLVSSGKRSEALRQYQACQRILVEEFGVEPSKETEALYERIRQGDERAAVPSIKPSTDDRISLFTRSVLLCAGRRLGALTRWVLPAVVVLLLGLAVIVAIGLPNGSSSLRMDSQVQPPVSEVSGEEASGLDEELASLPDLVDEREILVALCLSTDGDRWENADGWLIEDDHCNWYGITCTAGAVTGIDLQDNYLYGILPAELSGLRYLVELYLNGNRLMGEIPPELGQLEDLVGLNLGYNNLEGTIPPELGQLSKLKWLGLNGNANLRGRIPPELGELELLEDLVLSSHDGGTQLSGSIPPKLGQLSRLIHLVIANAMISGPIPPELGNLTRLQFLDLSNNPLSGSIPSEFGNLGDLWAFHVGEGPNALSGPLPHSFMQLNKLRVLQYHDTDICEPSDPDFQAWLEMIPELYRTGILCSTD